MADAVDHIKAHWGDGVRTVFEQVRDQPKHLTTKKALDQAFGPLIDDLERFAATSRGTDIDSDDPLSEEASWFTFLEDRDALIEDHLADVRREKCGQSEAATRRMLKQYDKDRARLFPPKKRPRGRPPKLTPEQVDAARLRIARGEPQYVVAREIGIKRHHLSKHLRKNRL